MSSVFASERPTLPPLHSLDLLNPITRKPHLQGVHAPHDLYDHYQRYNVRQVSDSSSATSRTSSPTPPPQMLGNSKPAQPLPLPSQPRSLLFYPCSLEEADAALLVPPPTTPYVPKVSDLGTPASSDTPKRNKCLLLVGPRLEELRQPGRRLAKGARIHPYRLVREHHPRRPSTTSIQSDE